MTTPSSLPGTYFTTELLVTVKAYPNPSTQYIETVCVAGITKEKQWIRLYPIPFRDLEYEHRFPTYAWIEAKVARALKDYRPESHRIDIDTIVIKGKVNTAHGWEARKSFILPLVSPSIEYLQDQFKQHRTSLGIIRPKLVRRLVIRPDRPEWSPEELAKLRQHTLFDKQDEGGTEEAVKELEKIPYRFLYEFECEDSACKGHTFSIISWEVLQSYRNWRKQYGDKWEWAFRQKYEMDFLDKSKHDLHFFVGNHSRHPHIWSINGLFYPPASFVIQPSLF